MNESAAVRIPYIRDIVRLLFSLRWWTRTMAGGIGGLQTSDRGVLLAVLFPEHIQRPIHTKADPEVLLPDLRPPSYNAH